MKNKNIKIAKKTRISRIEKLIYRNNSKLKTLEGLVIFIE